MPKITLYLTEDLQQRMSGEECNWSKLFAEAVERELRDPCPGTRLGFLEIGRILHDLEKRGLLSNTNTASNAACGSET